MFFLGFLKFKNFYEKKKKKKKHWAGFFLFKPGFFQPCRQAAIDVLVAGGLSDEMLSQIASERPPPSAAVNEAAGTGSGAVMSAEHVRTVMEDCQRVVVPDDSRILGCWGLIDADETTGTGTVRVR